MWRAEKQAFKCRVVRGAVLRVGGGVAANKCPSKQVGRWQQQSSRYCLFCAVDMHSQTQEGRLQDCAGCTRFKRRQSTGDCRSTSVQRHGSTHASVTRLVTITGKPSPIDRLGQLVCGSCAYAVPCRDVPAQSQFTAVRGMHIRSLVQPSTTPYASRF